MGGVGGENGVASGRLGWQPRVELALICAVVGLAGVLGHRVFDGLLEAGAWWMVPVGALLGVVAADFFSGVVHWFGDSFFREESPVIGPMLIAPFREHHRDPEAITRHGLLELHGNSCVPVGGALLLALVFMPGTWSPLWLLLYVWLLFFALGASATNQFHVWAHRKRVPAVALALQRHRLILTADEHRLHHSGTFRRSYCITTGWLNPILDRIAFFPRLEHGIRAVLRRRA
jgi:hypothetical protein